MNCEVCNKEMKFDNEKAIYLCQCGVIYLDTREEIKE